MPPVLDRPETLLIETLRPTQGVEMGGRRGGNRSHVALTAVVVDGDDGVAALVGVDTEDQHRELLWCWWDGRGQSMGTSEFGRDKLRLSHLARSAPVPGTADDAERHEGQFSVERTPGTAAQTDTRILGVYRQVPTEGEATDGPD
jgi:hypothetical protein